MQPSLTAKADSCSFAMVTMPDVHKCRGQVTLPFATCPKRSPRKESKRRSTTLMRRDFRPAQRLSRHWRLLHRNAAMPARKLRQPRRPGRLMCRLCRINLTKRSLLLLRLKKSASPRSRLRRNRGRSYRRIKQRPRPRVGSWITRLNLNRRQHNCSPIPSRRTLRQITRRLSAARTLHRPVRRNRPRIYER